MISKRRVVSSKSLKTRSSHSRTNPRLANITVVLLSPYLQSKGHREEPFFLDVVPKGKVRALETCASPGSVVRPARRSIDTLNI